MIWICVLASCHLQKEDRALDTMSASKTESVLSPYVLRFSRLARSQSMPFSARSTSDLAMPGGWALCRFTRCIVISGQKERWGRLLKCSPCYWTLERQARLLSIRLV